MAAFRIQAKKKPVDVKLLNLDPDGETKVTIRQADGNDQETVESMSATNMMEYEVDGTRAKSWNAPPLNHDMAVKAWTVMEDCNILNEEGKKLFSEGMTYTEFKEAWNRLPPVAWRDIFSAVLEVNPHWGNPQFGVLT